MMTSRCRGSQIMQKSRSCSIARLKVAVTGVMLIGLLALVRFAMLDTTVPCNWHSRHKQHMDQRLQRWDQLLEQLGKIDHIVVADHMNVAHMNCFAGLGFVSNDHHHHCVDRHRHVDYLFHADDMLAQVIVRESDTYDHINFLHDGSLCLFNRLSCTDESNFTFNIRSRGLSDVDFALRC